MSLVEALAVLLGLTYLLLAIRERRSCWIAGAAASAIFLGVFWKAGLPMQALLQIFYVLIAAYSWLRWGAGKTASQADKNQGPIDPGIAITRCTTLYHLNTLALFALLTASTLAVGAALGSTSPDVQDVLDVVSSWGGVIATWMIAQKKLEAWLYWIVIDAATAGLYVRADLLASAGLYLLYTGLAFVGWREWQSTYRRASASS